MNWNQSKILQIRLFDGTAHLIKLEQEDELDLITIRNKFYLFVTIFSITREI